MNIQIMNGSGNWKTVDTDSLVRESGYSFDYSAASYNELYGYACDTYPNEYWRLTDESGLVVSEYYA